MEVEGRGGRAVSDVEVTAVSVACVVVPRPCSLHRRFPLGLRRGRTTPGGRAACLALA